MKKPTKDELAQLERTAELLELARENSAAAAYRRAAARLRSEKDGE